MKKTLRSVLQKPRTKKNISAYLSWSKNNYYAAKIQNNAELEKHFWRNHAICPINKGNSGKNEESLKVGTKQIYAVR
jgi:hypothetical protein